MIKSRLFPFIIATILFSCTPAAKKEPVTDTDVATAFIRAVLDNDFKTAEKYLLHDDTNQQYFETFRHQYQSKNEKELQQYKAADILINEIKPATDSLHFVTYSNTYERNVNNNLKLVWTGGKWLVDLKYTFEKTQ